MTTIELNSDEEQKQQITQNDNEIPDGASLRPNDIYKPEDLKEMEGFTEDREKTTYRKLQVHLRITVDEVTFIDTQNQRYGVKGVITRMWKSTAQDQQNWKRDPSAYEPQFCPNFLFMNSVEEITHEAARVVIKDKYNRQEVKYNMSFTEEFEIENFPFDLQDLSIVFRAGENLRSITYDSPPNHIFTSYIAFEKTWFSITDWKIVNVDLAIIEDEFKSSYQGQTYEILVFRIQVKRKWKGIIYRLIIWLLFLGIMSWSTFGISSEDIGSRLSYSITMALTIVAFQFIISDRLPQVNYMTLLDKYNLFIFSLVLFITVESTIVGYDQVGLIPNAVEIDAICGYVFLLVFILGNVLFVLYARYVNKCEHGKVKQWKEIKRNIMRTSNDEKIHRMRLGHGDDRDVEDTIYKLNR